MITDFDKFEKTNSDIDELKSIRVNNFNIFWHIIVDHSKHKIIKCIFSQGISTVKAEIK